MKRRSFVKGVAVASVGAPYVGAGLVPAPSSLRTTLRLDTGWKFLLGDAPGAERPAFNDASWQSVSLPHTARIEALVAGPANSPSAQWQGTCWYRRTLRVEGPSVLLRFGGAMNVADVWLDGERVGGHLGGWLPFVIDLTRHARAGADRVLAVRLDNRDNPITGPKPLVQLDYNFYHGLYRGAELVSRGRLHFTDALLENRPAGGGLFVTYPRVTRERATVRVQSHIRNQESDQRQCRIRLTLRGAGNRTLATVTSGALVLAPGADQQVVQELEITSPRLWSPAEPNLHVLHAELITGAGVVDDETIRVGIRRLAITPGAFRLNDEPLFLRGTNRHQEYPYIGYALSDTAQYRDAQRIKDAGFDYVRLSHYPHAPAFMDACDELGLVVMNCIPGWQFFNPDPAFIELQYQNCRDLVRRDRNHACVALWEVSLNESAMTPEFVARTHAIAHEEYPGDQCFTAGWMRGYDVFLDARQHGGCRSGRDPVCLVSEYGDWEYYAMNAGLDQQAYANLTPAESNSRQLRWQGERAQLQQATNFQEAHNDNLATRAIGDGLWVMYDYNRGYAPDIESSGCMDIFRLPKFSYHFFRSQRPPANGAVVFIASFWNASSNPDVRVFSNCDEVALYLDGRLIERKRAERDRISERVPYPPFTFRTGGFRPGMLAAIGYVRGRRAARHEVRTPGPVANVSLSLDTAVRGLSEERDTVLCYASLRDANGTLINDAWENVAFGALGGITLVGMNPASSDAGVASILLDVAPGRAPAAVYALIMGPGRPIGASLALRGRALAHGVRPSAGGAELLAGNRVVASLPAGAPKYRIPATSAPSQRDPFRR